MALPDSLPIPAGMTATMRCASMSTVLPLFRMCCWELALPRDRELGELEGRYLKLVSGYWRMLRAAIVRCSCASGAQLEDLEQEARLKIWKALRSGRTITNPTSYLYRIAVNTALDSLRRARSCREEALQTNGYSNPADEPGPATPGPASPEQGAIHTQMVSRVLSCVARLSENRRRAVGLHLQGFTTTEIGNLLGWTEAKARNLVYRGLGDLRELLRAEGIEYEAE